MQESLGCTHRNPQIKPKAEKQKARGRGGSLTAKLIEMPGGCSSLRGRGSSLGGGGGERLPAVLGAEEERGMSSPLHLELRGQSVLCPQREEARQPRARLGSPLSPTLLPRVGRGRHSALEDPKSRF